MVYIITFLVGFLGTLFAIPLIKGMLRDSNFIQENYRKDMVPVSMGISFLPFFILSLGILRYFGESYRIFILMYGSIAMAFAGLLDDTLGDKHIKGLKGHLKSFFHGKLTTGGFKALFGGLVALSIAMGISKNIQEILVNTLVMALFTNLMNLLDLRPGRALKVFFAISITFMIMVEATLKLLMWTVMLPPLAYFKDDIKAKGMMGDTGSNFLGISLGIICALGFDFKSKLIVLGLLILIHIITEKYSLTKIIEKNKFLNFLDRLGRN